MEKKANRGRLWNVFGSEQFLRGIWENFTGKRAGARKTSSGCCSGEARRIARSVATRAFINEILKQIKRSADTDCGPQTMRRAYIAMKHGNWESFKEEYRK